MAKIKISGYSELIEITNEKAKTIRDLLLDESVDRYQMLDINGSIMIPKKNIISVFLDQETNTENDLFKKRFEDYNKRRKEILEMPIYERVKVNAWAHFKLFYWAVYNKNPKEDEWKIKVLEKAAKYFEDNPMRCVPSILVWFDLLGLPKNQELDKNAFRVLENNEGNELFSINGYNQFIEKKSEEELTPISFNRLEII